MKAASFVAVLACMAVAIPAQAQVPGTDVEGMTVSATTVDGGGVERGTETASITDFGGGLFGAQPVDPVFAAFLSAKVHYCDPSTSCISPDFLPMPGGTWVAAYHFAGVSRLLFDASASGMLFTGTASWLGYFGAPPVNYGTFTFLNAIAGGWSQMQIDFVPALGTVSGEAPFTLGMETHDYGSTVPEPSTWVLMLTGVLAIGFVTWRRRGQVEAA